MDFRKMIRILCLLACVFLSVPVFADDMQNDLLYQPNRQKPEETSQKKMLPPPPRVGPGRAGVLNQEDSPYEYRIGVRDLLEIQVFQVEELNHTSRVNTRGHISMPLIG
jgi:protein involved in polysaccharide export with SLBB domain